MVYIVLIKYFWLQISLHGLRPMQICETGEHIQYSYAILFLLIGIRLELFQKLQWP